MGEFNGLLVIDKPAGITSRDAVNRVQSWFPKGTRIGHAGTLDPLATGVLVLCIGNATRLTEYVQQMPKLYRAGIHLGATSDTDDADGQITTTPGITVPTREQIEQELCVFIGNIEQTPPAFSAVKVTGRRAHELARKGKVFELEPRTVRIDRIEILRYGYPHLDLEVHCGKGTYIRSLARDLGQRLGCGGYIATLRRLTIGWFDAADAVSLEADSTRACERLLPAWRAIQDWPPPILSEEELAKLRQGQRIPHVYGPRDHLGVFAVLDDEGRTAAIVAPMMGELQPIKVFGAKN